jgi:nitroreductase
LAATALRLSACPIAALYDDEVNEILGVDGREESILYMAAVGTPASGSSETPGR